jgi:hypothetical protein
MVISSELVVAAERARLPSSGSAKHHKNWKSPASARNVAVPVGAVHDVVAVADTVGMLTAVSEAVPIGVAETVAVGVGEGVVDLWPSKKIIMLTGMNSSVTTERGRYVSKRNA